MSLALWHVTSPISHSTSLANLSRYPLNPHSSLSHHLSLYLQVHSHPFFVIATYNISMSISLLRIFSTISLSRSPSSIQMFGFPKAGSWAVGEDAQKFQHHALALFMKCLERMLKCSNIMLRSYFWVEVKGRGSPVEELPELDLFISILI